MKILNLEEEFKISVETFFTFFFENANFKQKYHSSRGDNQIEVKAWTPTSDSRYTREVSFCSFISNNPVINRLVGDKAKVREVQFYKYIENGSLNVTSETFFEGSSIGKSFSSISEWTVSPISNPLPGCKVIIKVKNNYNGTMFKGVLENWVHDTTEDSFKQWLSLVRQQVEEYEKNEQLKRITPTPVKQQQQQQQQINNNNNSVKNRNYNNNSISDNEDEIDNHRNNSSATTTYSSSSTSSSSVIIVDENHKSVIKQQQQQQRYNNSNSVQHINSLGNGDDDFSDSELSDISRKAPSHLDFNTDDEENEQEDEEEHDDDDDFEFEQSTNNDDDKFYDSNDVWQSNSRSKKDIKNFMIDINNDISHLKSIIEVNHNRLFGLEDAFNQIQKTSNNNHHHNNTTTTITTTTRSSPTLLLGGGTTQTTINGQSSTTLVDSTYLSRLEECIKNIQDDEIKTREKQKEWIEKISELEKKLNSVGTAQSRSVLWINVLALVFFLVGWPIVAKKLWKSLSPFLTSLLTKK